MKKLIAGFILITMLLSLTACNSPEDTIMVKDGTYVLQSSGTTEVTLPTITIEANNISFSYDMLSSYYPNGTYTLENDTLTMTTDDEVYKYIFKVEEDTLIFQKENSSQIKLTNDSIGIKVTDQSKFKRQNIMEEQ